MSKLFLNAPKNIEENLSKDNNVYNSNIFCLTEDSFMQNDLHKDWQIIATSKDTNGFEFVSIFESRKYPFYGVQFHPEKTNFEFKKCANIPHNQESIYISQYFANFFVQECRRNNQRYPDWKTEQKALIYNYMPHFTGIQNSSYMQLYMFKNED